MSVARGLVTVVSSIVFILSNNCGLVFTDGYFFMVLLPAIISTIAVLYKN